MRAYFMQNMYLQGIHAGIQSQHTTTRMFIKYNPMRQKPLSQDRNDIVFCNASDTLYEWGIEHESSIILNGGYASNLKSIVETLTRLQMTLKLPWGCFYESNEALNGCITNVGIIVPARIYDSILVSERGAVLPEYEYCGTPLTSAETELKVLLSSMRLMT